MKEEDLCDDRIFQWNGASGPDNLVDWPTANGLRTKTHGVGHRLADRLASDVIALDEPPNAVLALVSVQHVPQTHGARPRTPLHQPPKPGVDSRAGTHPNRRGWSRFIALGVWSTGAAVAKDDLAEFGQGHG
ncbi:MAG: hypothetical protein OXR82_18170 [Gammaproteobacteria bacterium]|nr:hypothetical protein [Gammaproteobacteria bacterium]